MDRRQYLASVATAGAASLLAGCLDDVSFEMGGDEDDGRSGDRETVSDADGGDEPDSGSSVADDEITRTVGQLNRAAVSISAVEEELEDPESVEFDAEEPLEYVSEGRDHLETALEEAEGDLAITAEELAGYADVLEAIVVVIDALTEGTLQEDVDAVRAALEDLRLDDASATIEDIGTEATELRETLDPALEALSSLDRERLEDRDTVEIDSVEGGARRLDEAVSGIETIATVLAHLVDGYEALERGDGHFEADEYGPAETAFEEASSSFDDAVTTIDEDREDASEGFREYFDTLRCQAVGLADGTGLLAGAAADTAAGDRESARQKREDGEAALEEAEAC